MTSNFYIKGAPLYRVVGKKPHAKIYKLPYVDMSGANRELKEITFNTTNKSKSGWGWWITFEDVGKKYITKSKINNYLVAEKMIIKDKEKGMPF
jgi:hypothetical protein